MSKVTVYLQGRDDGHVFDGQFDAGVTPGNCLIVSEMVPDVLNQNKGQPVPAIRSIYNPATWAQVGVSDEVDTDIVGSD